MSKSCAPFKNEEIWDNNDATYSHATHYTYDIHGNVNTLLQDNPNTGVAGQEFKRLDYAYDLISGNVNEVVYQEGQLDMMIHRYEYDSDNRITSVETSTDGVFFDNDAKYFYYAHGPLARTELGENQVQGLDYVYTLQGWIKGVNSNTLDTTRDVGQDGNRVVGNPNAYFAKDVFGYTLNYFAGDYNAINSTVSQTPNNFEADKTNSDLLTSRKDFFNGNISAMVTTITNPTTGEVLPQGMAYDYDQLNRLLSAKAFVNLDMQTNTWQSGSTYANRYFNAFTYDANGNILTQTRYAENGTQIEDLTYQYNRNTNGKMLQNRLYHVNDNVAATAFTDDIDDQGTFSNTNHNNTNNYSYDGEGRLVRDDAEEIASITWTVTGKVKEVIRTSGSTKKNLKFRYDAMGQRIAKEVYDSQNNWEKTTYYVRDPQGNVMGIYEKKNDAQTQQLSYKIKERYVYGSSVVGLITNEAELVSANNPSGSSFVHIIGEKTIYESNHLGNLLSTVSDKLIAYDWDNDLIVDYYRAEILSSADYSGFGVKLDGRNFVVKKPRVDFNGKETDEETEWQDYGMRIYDSRIGRFLSPDPLRALYQMLSTYQFAENCPIHFIDLDGMEGYDPNNKYNHYEFFTTSAIKLYDAAKGKGATTAGAMFVIAQAALESNYGEIAKSDFNFFNIKAGAGQAKGRKATDGGYFRDYSKEGGIDAAFQDYYNKISSGHGGWTGDQLIRQEKITADDIDKSFNTGDYFPTKDELKQGQYSYAGATKEASKDYGRNVYRTMITSQKLMINALGYRIAEVQKQKDQLGISITERVANGGLDKMTTEERVQFDKDVAQWNTLGDELNKLNQVKSEVQNAQL